MFRSPSKLPKLISSSSSKKYESITRSPLKSTLEEEDEDEEDGNDKDDSDDEAMITNIGPTKPEEKQGSSFLEEEVSKETNEEEKTNQEELNTSTKEINVSMISKSPEKETSAASVHEQEPQSESEETAKEVENENKSNDIMSQNAEEQEKDEENKDAPKLEQNDTLAVIGTKEEHNIQGVY